MLEWVRNMPAFRMYLTMFYVIVIITNLRWDIQIPIWLGDNFSSFEYSRKIALTTFLRKAGRGRDSSSLSQLIQYKTHAPCMQNSNYHSNKKVPPPFFDSDTNPVFGDVLIHSSDKIHVLVVIVESVWLLLLNILSFNLVPT